MHVFVLFLAWAVVSGASAWSSSEVSCGSCGLECQKACGTRNFRACCFNFQRRKKAQTSFYSMKEMEDPGTEVLQRLMGPLTEKTDEPQLRQILRSLTRHVDGPSKGASQLRDPQLLFSIYPAFLQESSEEAEEGRDEGADDGSVLRPSQDSRSSLEDEALNRLVEMAYNRQPLPPFRRQLRQTLYPQSPSKIIK